MLCDYQMDLWWQLGKAPFWLSAGIIMMRQFAIGRRAGSGVGSGRRQCGFPVRRRCGAQIVLQNVAAAADVEHFFSGLQMTDKQELDSGWFREKQSIRHAGEVGEHGYI